MHADCHLFVADVPFAFFWLDLIMQVWQLQAMHVAFSVYHFNSQCLFLEVHFDAALEHSLVHWLLQVNIDLHLVSVIHPKVLRDSQLLWLFWLLQALLLFQ